MPPSLPKGGHEVHTPHTEQIRSGLVSAAPPTSIRERLEALRSDVLDLAHRHGASNLRVYGSIATGLEHESSDLDLLVDLSPEHSLLGVISLRPGSGRPARLLGGCHRRDIPAPPDPRRNPRPGSGVVSKDRLYLESISDCLERIAEYTEAGEETFLASRLIQDGVIRNLEVIGEATKNLSAELRAANQEIPWRQIAGMRDVLIHDYLKVNLTRVWRTVVSDLPPLQEAVTRLLSL